MQQTDVMMERPIDNKFIAAIQIVNLTRAHFQFKILGTLDIKAGVLQTCGKKMSRNQQQIATHANDVIKTVLPPGLHR